MMKGRRNKERGHIYIKEENTRIKENALVNYLFFFFQMFSI